MASCETPALTSGASKKEEEPGWKEAACPEPARTVVKIALTETTGNASVMEGSPAGTKERLASVLVLSPGSAMG